MEAQLEACVLFYAGVGFASIPKGNFAAAFYYACQAGLSIGFGKLAEVDDGSRLFTIFFNLIGALFVASYLSSFVVGVLERAGDDGDRTQAGIALPGGVLPWYAAWLLLGASFGRFHEGWSWITSLYFATTALSTGGLQAIDSSDNLSFAFVGCYVLLGVPLFAAAVGQAAERLASVALSARRAQLRSRAVAQMTKMTGGVLDTDSLRRFFQAYDRDGNGFIDRQEIVALIVALEACNGMQVDAVDVDFFVEEWDTDAGGDISLDEFIVGMRRWTGRDLPQNGPV